MSKHNYEDIKNHIESNRYELLSKEYKNANKKFQMRCPEGHIIGKSYNNFQQGHRCHECGGSKRFTIDQVRKEYNKESYELLSGEYKNTHEYLEIKCNKGHVYNASFMAGRQGQRCPKCYGTIKPEYEFIKGEIEKEEYELLSSEYKNCKSKLLLRCSNGHKCSISWSNFRRGRRCAMCYLSSNSSKPEKELQEFVKSVTDTKVIDNIKGVVKNPKTKTSFELDIYLPEIKKAIEFNGVYGHSKDIVKERDKIKN